MSQHTAKNFILWSYYQGVPRPAIKQPEGHKIIPLANSDKVVLVDNEVYPFLSWINWRDVHGYAENGTLGRMHRIILGMKRRSLPTPAEQVDHINGDTYDNRFRNLRAVSPAQNAMNKEARGRSSRYKGVAWHVLQRRWIARIGLSGKTFVIGYFYDEEEAAYAYDQWSLQLHGEFGRTNFDYGTCG